MSVCILDSEYCRQCSNKDHLSNQILCRHKPYKMELAETYCDVIKCISQPISAHIKMRNTTVLHKYSLAPVKNIGHNNSISDVKFQ